MANRAIIHRSYSAEHYTPAPYVEAARLVLERIDLDPASNEVANETVRAARFYTADDDGLAQPWVGRCWLNSPNDRRGRLLKAFWLRANEHALFGGASAAVLWAGFSLGQLGSLLAVGELHDGRPCPAPQKWPMVTIGPKAPCTSTSGRICWISGKTGRPGTQPGAHNFFALLGGDRAMRARFLSVFGAFGEPQVPAQPLKVPARDRTIEILAVLRERGPLTKTAAAAAIGGRKTLALRAVDALARAGQIARDKVGCWVPRSGESDTLEL